jgi:hypothetical protein
MIVEELRAHRLRQAEELLRLGIRPTDETFVVSREDGLPLQPQTLTHEWKRLVAKTGLPRIRLHDLRHSHATAMLATGVHPKIASERLGHSKVGITLDLYSHVLPGMQEDAVAKVDAAMQANGTQSGSNPVAKPILEPEKALMFLGIEMLVQRLLNPPIRVRSRLVLCGHDGKSGLNRRSTIPSVRSRSVSL